MHHPSFSYTFRCHRIGFAICLLLCVSCDVIPSNRISNSTPSIPAYELLLETDPFPEKWQADPCDPERCQRPQLAWRTFGIVGVPGHVNQTVSRFPNSEAAQAEFRLVREMGFKASSPPQIPNTDFIPPQEITYRSPIADEYHFGCGVDIVPACRAIFRYGNYYLELYFDLDSYQGYGLDHEGDGLKLEEVEPILRAMDEKAGEILGIALPTRTP